MLMFMRRIVLLSIVFLSCFPSAVPAETVRLSADQWSRPRTGAMIVEFPELNRLVEQFERQPNGVLLIRHDPADEGVFWAVELRSWFVALGIPSSRIRLLPDSEVHGEILIEPANGRSSP